MRKHLIKRWENSDKGGFFSYIGYLLEDKPSIPYGKTAYYILRGSDLKLALIIFVIAFISIYSDPSLCSKIRNHFGELISVTSILFGFCLTSLTFFVQSASSWNSDPKVDQIGKLAVELHVWSLMTWLGNLSYILALWFWGRLLNSNGLLHVCLYSSLVFLFAYGCFQILSQVLEMSVLFHERKKIQKERSPLFILCKKCLESQRCSKEDESNEPEGSNSKVV